MLALLLALALQSPAAPPPAAPPGAAPHDATAADPLRGDWSSPSGKRITLSGSLSVNDALERIADAAGWSVVLDTGDAGSRTLTLRLRDVPAEDALRAALTGSGLIAERRGGLVVVHPGGLLDQVLPPGLSQEAHRTAEEALRRAQQAMHDAMSRKPRSGEPDGGKDREVTGSDVTVSPAEDVRDVSVVKGDLRIEPGAAVRDAAVVMGNLRIGSGAAARDAVAVLGGATLEVGSSAREVVAVLGDVDIGPGAAVEKDVVSVGGHIRVDPTAHVGGSQHAISFPSLPEWPGKLGPHLVSDIPSPVSLVLGTLVRFAVLFVLGLVVLAVIPRRMEAVSAAMVSGPWWSLFAGLLGSVGMVVLAILLVVTVIGILLVPVQLLLVVGGGVLGVTALTYYLGRLLPFPSSRRTAVVQLAAGTLLFSIAAEIPILGAMVWVATWFLGFGAVLRTRFGQPPAAPLPTMPAPPAA